MDGYMYNTNRHTASHLYMFRYTKRERINAKWELRCTGKTIERIKREVKSEQKFIQWKLMDDWMK